MQHNQEPDTTITTIAEILHGMHASIDIRIYKSHLHIYTENHWVATINYQPPNYHIRYTRPPQNQECSGYSFRTEPIDSASPTCIEEIINLIQFTTQCWTNWINRKYKKACPTT